MFANSLCPFLLPLVLLLLVALLLLLVGMPADFVETRFRLLVYPKRLQASLGYTQSQNHGCTTLLQLVTWLNNRGHFQVSQENTTHGTHFFKWSDTTTTMVLFFARRQALMNTKWFRLLVYPKLGWKSLGYTKSRNNFVFIKA